LASQKGWYFISLFFCFNLTIHKLGQKGKDIMVSLSNPSADGAGLYTILRQAHHDTHFFKLIALAPDAS
jgi:hypothetical protein